MAGRRPRANHLLVYDALKLLPNAPHSRLARRLRLAFGSRRLTGWRFCLTGQRLSLTGGDSASPGGGSPSAGNDSSSPGLARLLHLVGEWQRKAERRAHADFAVRPDPTAVGLHETFRNGQPK